MKTTHFILYGIHGVYNYGCEAIVRGTVLLLREKWAKSEITYVTPTPEDDAQRLKGLKVNILPRYGYHRYSPKNLLRKVASILGIPWDPFMEKSAYLKAADVILSIGGDLYTLSADGVRYARRLMQFGDIAMRRGKKLVIWGASVGPFEGNQKAKEAYSEHLKRVDLITLREKTSIEYLTSLGITENVARCADPAFIVHRTTRQKEPANRRLRIGVNYSPLSISFLQKSLKMDEFASLQASNLEKILKRYDAEIRLIPHVICAHNRQDDDLSYLRLILNCLPNNYSDRILLVDTDPGFLGLGDVIADCDLVIAARMHCAINAMSLGVPTILVSYSQKAQGMTDYVYGHRKWLVPLAETITDSFVEKIGKLIQERESVCDHLRNRLPGIRMDARAGVEALARMLGE